MKTGLSDKQKSKVQQMVVNIQVAQMQLNTYLESISEERGLANHTFDLASMEFKEKRDGNTEREDSTS